MTPVINHLLLRAYQTVSQLLMRSGRRAPTGANGLALNGVRGFREKVCRWMAGAIPGSFAGFIQGFSDEQFARQELNALKVDSRKLCAILGIRGAK